MFESLAHITGSHVHYLAHGALDSTITNLRPLRICIYHSLGTCLCSNVRRYIRGAVLHRCSLLNFIAAFRHALPVFFVFLCFETTFAIVICSITSFISKRQEFPILNPGSFPSKTSLQTVASDKRRNSANSLILTICAIMNPSIVLTIRMRFHQPCHRWEHRKDCSPFLRLHRSAQRSKWTAIT